MTPPLSTTGTDGMTATTVKVCQEVLAAMGLVMVFFDGSHLWGSDAPPFHARYVMKALSVFLLIVVAGGALADEPATALKEFTSKECAFSVMMPGTPTTTKTPDKNGGPDQYQFTIAANDGAYLVIYNETPNLKNAAKDLLLKALVKSQAAAQAGVNGNLLGMQELTLDKQYPGREVKLSGKSGSDTLYYTWRIYLVDGKMYQVVAAGTKDFVATDVAKKFLESLKIVK